MIEIEVTLEYGDGGRIEVPVERSIDERSRYDITVDDWFDGHVLRHREFYGHVVGARAVGVHRPVGGERRGRREVLYSRGVSSSREVAGC